MKLRQLATWCVLTLLVAVLSAPVTVSGQPKKAGEPAVTIKVWGAVQEDQGVSELLANFMKENPNIKAEYVFYKNDPAGNTKLSTALMAGDDVDVFINYGARRIDPRAKGGQALDLTPYITKDRLNMKENFGTDYFTLDGKVYALPASTLKTLVWINQQALAEAGLALPKKDWTWEDYKEYARKLTKGDGANKRYGSIWFDPGYSFTTPARGLLGADYYYKADGTSNFDHPAFKMSLAYKLELENQLKVQENRIEFLMAKMNYWSEFFTGKAAMMIGSDAMLRHALNQKDYPRNWKVAFANLPRYDQNTKVNYMGRTFFDYIAVSKNSKNKDAAWKLAKYWATKGSIYMFKYGRGSAWKKTDVGKVSELIISAENQRLFDMASFKKVFLDYASPGYNDSDFTAYAQLDQIVTEEYEKAQLGSITVEQALDNMKKRADKEIAKEKGK
jgi:multiple sugar transport system substrate-binding protein